MSVNSELTALSTPSATAVGQFASAQDRLTEAVLRSLGCSTGADPVGTQDWPAAAADCQPHFARTLHAVYEFGLLPALADEFHWYIETMNSRGAPPGHFRRVLDAWSLALLTVLPAVAGRALVRPLDILRARLDELLGAPPLPPPLLSEHQQQFLDRLLNKQRRAAAEFALARLDNRAALQCCEELVFPALNQVGRLWQHNQISVADEHSATDIARHVILRLFDAVAPARPVPHSALVTCVPGEEHELGAEALTGHLETMGWTVWFIGHSTPGSELLRTTTRLRPAVVFLAVNAVANLVAARDLVQELRIRQPEVRLIVGGRAAASARIALKDGVDLVAPDIAACTAATELVKGHA